MPFTGNSHNDSLNRTTRSGGGERERNKDALVSGGQGFFVVVVVYGQLR